MFFNGRKGCVNQAYSRYTEQAIISSGADSGLLIYYLRRTDVNPSPFALNWKTQCLSSFDLKRKTHLILQRFQGNEWQPFSLGNGCANVSLESLPVRLESD